MLESLPNELLLTAFQYLDLIHLIRAFHNLNNRFDQLLSVTTGNEHLDCRSLSKNDFEWFAQHHLASIDTRVRSWRFSDDLETPDFSQHYLSIGLPINRMQCLKSLSIDRIVSFERLNQITSQFRALPRLTHLRLAIENSQDRELHFRNFITHIWSSPTLTHCDLDIIYPYSAWLLNISETSSSLLDLSLKHIDCHADILASVFQHTPHLRRLSIDMFGSFTDQIVPRIFSPLLSLSISMNDHSTIQSMRNLFQQTPNVRHLTVRAKRLQLDGQHWQQILTSHFPSLKTFRLMMTVAFSWSDDVEEQVDLLLDLFRSEFWLDKHRLFVQYHWPPTSMDRTGLLYTLPYPSDTFDLIDGIRSKSTNPDQLDMNAASYDQVTHLHHINRRRDFDENQLVCSFAFQCIRHLKVNLPFDESFWSQIPTLTHLTSLDVTLNQTFSYCQLQILLDRSPHLYSLRFSHTVPFSIDAFRITSTSLRRLETRSRLELQSTLFQRRRVCCVCSHICGSSM